MAQFALSVNEKKTTVDVDADTSLLYVLSDELGLRGPRFGCGLAQCGSCSVLVDVPPCDGVDCLHSQARNYGRGYFNPERIG